MAFTHFCWLTKLLLLLLLIWQTLHAVDTRPARGSPTSDLIAGNEFLKLFMGRDELQRDLHSSEYQGHADGGGPLTRSQVGIENLEDNFTESGIRSVRNNARSLDYKHHNGGHMNHHTTFDDDDGKQVVKLVTSGSKIVFLEEYDDADDAVVDAVARDIDLKREKIKKTNHKANDENHFYQESKSMPGDEFKVVAVSVSSSSKRGSAAANEPPKQVSKFTIKSELPAEHESRFIGGSPTTTIKPFNVQKTTSPKTYTTTSTTKRPMTTTTTTATTTSASTTATLTPISISATNNDIDDFINRSHKSEFSIEEAEPLTMPQKQHKMRRAHASTPDSGNDSENSASTNIRNVLASPALIQSASVRSSSIVPANINRNSTQSHSAARQPRINQSTTTYDNSATEIDAGTDTDTGTATDLVEDKLLPFQTVIYHDTKEGHGPQSRSISYSSISQNVDDIQAWQHAGILGEAQRNVSESLKPTTSPKSLTHTQAQTHPHESEPSKFYSVPSKMYSVPSKFYSEPSKVYSQPAKVYGQPEKFYSEPAKVYGQPSKFYSEPAKVYSQPAKVYGEPAKTYWPQTTSITTTTTSTSTTTTTVTPASQSIITTFAPFAAPFNLTSRRPPAIVSRIAFGEAQSSTPPPLSTDVDANFGQRASPTYQQQQQQRYQQNNHQNTHHSLPHQNQYQTHKSHNHAHQHGSNTQSRRVLFNLDRLPYDLLNAPEQHLLEPDLSKSQPHHPCTESAVLATSSSPQQHLRQQSSFSDQHSNQNAKGLPNRDLVKCVSKYSAHHSGTAAESAARRPPASSSQHHFTTERSHIEELYQPTPEQNYEIEESVSVMTNGRAHGVQGGSGAGVGVGPVLVTMLPTSTTSTPPKALPTRNRFRPGLHAFGHTNINSNLGDNDGEHDGALVHHNINGKKSNNNNNHNPHHQYHNKNNSNNNNNNDGYNDDGNEDNNEGNIDGDSDGDGDGNDEDDDSKFAVVVEGRNYRKYRVEEKTDDGFIVGEFGVVDHNDGNLRGVRYTADSTINPSLIQKALVAFLKLK